MLWREDVTRSQFGSIERGRPRDRAVSPEGIDPSCPRRDDNRGIPARENHWSKGSRFQIRLRRPYPNADLRNTVEDAALVANHDVATFENYGRVDHGSRYRCDYVPFSGKVRGH